MLGILNSECVDGLNEVIIYPAIKILAYDYGSGKIRITSAVDTSIDNRV